MKRFFSSSSTKDMDAVVIQDKLGGKMSQGFNACASAKCSIYARRRFEEKLKLGYLH